MSNYKFVNKLVNMWFKIHKNKRTLILYYLLRMDKYVYATLVTDYNKRNVLNILAKYELSYRLPEEDYKKLLSKCLYASELEFNEINDEIKMMDETITRYEKKEDRLLYER